LGRKVCPKANASPTKEAKRSTDQGGVQGDAKENEKGRTTGGCPWVGPGRGGRK